VWALPISGDRKPRQFAASGGSAKFSPDGKWVAYCSDESGRFYVSSLDGTGTSSVQLQGFRWVKGLDWNAVTNRILLLSTDDSGADIVWSVRPDGKDVRRLYSDVQPMMAMCSSPAAGVLYLFRERSGTSEFLRLPLSDAMEQGPTVLASGLPLVSHDTCNVSTDGKRLLYARGSEHTNIWRLDLRGAAPATSLTRGTSTLRFPRVSPDRQWIVATQGADSEPRIVKIPIGGGEPAQLAAGGAAAWSPDGLRLAFVSSLVSAAQRVLITDAHGLGAREVKDAGSGGDVVTWLSDGRLAWRTVDGRNYRIRDLVSGREELLVPNPEVGWIFEPHFSPRGDQVAVYPF
jgi:WD40 repeat protein